jgi:hypothetical protein
MRKAGYLIGFNSNARADDGTPNLSCGNALHWDFNGLDPRKFRCDVSVNDDDGTTPTAINLVTADFVPEGHEPQQGTMYPGTYTVPRKLACALVAHGVATYV